MLPKMVLLRLHSIRRRLCGVVVCGALLGFDHILLLGREVCIIYMLRGEVLQFMILRAGQSKGGS